MREIDTTKRRALGKGLEELSNNEQLDFNKIEEKIIDSDEGEFASRLSEKIDNVGLSKMDDVSIAGVFFGYESDKDLKVAANLERIKEVIAEYVKPIRACRNRTVKR